MQLYTPIMIYFNLQINLTKIQYEMYKKKNINYSLHVKNAHNIHIITSIQIRKLSNQKQ